MFASILASVAASLQGLAAAGEVEVQHTPHLLTLRQGQLCLFLYPDGRAIVEGTREAGEARAFLARLVGG